MNLIEKKLDWCFMRLAGSSALLITYYLDLGNGGISTITGYSIILLLDLILIWTREEWWDKKKYILFTSLIIVTVFGLKYGFGVNTHKLLWPLVWIFALRYIKYTRLMLILTSITIVSILFLSYTNTFPVATFFGLVGLFLTFSSRKIRQDAYRASQLHLQELNKTNRKLQETYFELQEASVHSMRYAALEERTRLAHEIHDGLGHQLTSLIVQLQALEIMLKSEPDNAPELVAQLLEIARRAMSEIRLAVREWSDDEMGLGLIALKGLISQTQARSSIQIKFIQDSEVSEWPIEISIVLYRILQESLTNVLRHSNATFAIVSVKEINDQVILTVADNGQFTEETKFSPGFGLNGIIERCRSQGGSCTFSAENPHGFRLVATIPIVPQDDNPEKEDMGVNSL